MQVIHNKPQDIEVGPMKSFERICTALKKNQPDRVPIMTMLSTGNIISERLREYNLEHTEVEQSLTCDDLTYFGFPMIGAAVEKTEADDGDGWTQEIFAGTAGKTYVRTWQYAENALYERYKNHLITDENQLEELLSLPRLKPCDSKGFNTWIERATKKIADCKRDSEYTTIVIQGPLAYLGYNISPENLAVWTITARPAIKAFLDEAVRRQAEFLEYLLEKMTMPYILELGGPEYALPPLMSPMLSTGTTDWSMCIAMARSESLFPALSRWVQMGFILWNRRDRPVTAISAKSKICSEKSSA
jgi:hypothetical protein